MLEGPTRPTVPYLYHYKGADHLKWLKSIILRSEIYFPTLAQLNDPADSRPRLTAPSTKSFVEAVGKGNEYQSEEYQQSASETERTIKKFGVVPLLRGMTNCFQREQDNVRIYCLSKRWDNLSMWAKYAGDHKGYCLEFANEGDPFGSTYEVIYDGPVTLDITVDVQRNPHYFLHKSKDWRCEEEVRIVRARGLPSLVTFDPKLLTRIILGKDMTECNRKKIRKWAQKRRPELEVVCAEYDAFEQKLVTNAYQGNPRRGKALQAMRQVAERMSAGIKYLLWLVFIAPWRTVLKREPLTLGWWFFVFGVIVFYLIVIVGALLVLGFLETYFLSNAPKSRS